MSDWPDTNPSLILRIKDPQNAAAWNQLMAIYRPVIYRLARRKGLLHEDAEDLVQGVFISIAKAIDLPSSHLCQACITGNYPTDCGQRLYTIAQANHIAGSGASRTYELNPVP
jgi:hypothetical protein